MSTRHLADLRAQHARQRHDLSKATPTDSGPPAKHACVNSNEPASEQKHACAQPKQIIAALITLTAAG